jgi:hypothetical protein
MPTIAIAGVMNGLARPEGLALRQPKVRKKALTPVTIGDIIANG